MIPMMEIPETAAHRPVMVPQPEPLPPLQGTGWRRYGQYGDTRWLCGWLEWGLGEVNCQITVGIHVIGSVKINILLRYIHQWCMLRIAE